MAQKGSVLIVDDEVGPRESLRLILNPIYEIHTAADGDEALRCIQDKDIDVVTLDLKMPGMSGFEVLRGIKKLKADIEVIIVTGYGTLKNAQEAIHYGAETVYVVDDPTFKHYLNKPYTVALTELVHSTSRKFF